MMKGKLKSFIIGVMCGGLLLGGVGFAASQLQIEVKLPHIPYIYDGKELSLGEDSSVPQTINYMDVNYVSVRALAEGLGKEVTWDAEEGRVLIHSVEQLDVTVVDDEGFTPSIERWVERARLKENVEIRTFDGDTYILLTMGEKPSAGYVITVKEIKQYVDEIRVYAETIEPDKGTLVTGAITYPYELVKLSGEQALPIKVLKDE